MKNFVIFVIVVAAAVLLLGITGTVNIPGITPTPTAPKGGADAQKLEPPKVPVANDAATKPAELKPSAAPQGLGPPPPTPAARAKNLLPPISPADLARARDLFAKGDFPGVQRALEGCEKSDVEDAATTSAARTLTKKARLLGGLTAKIQKNALATASSLEKITLDSGNTVVGKVTEKGDQLTIAMPGGVEIMVAKDSLQERVPASRELLEEKLRTRLKEKEARIKPDDALGNFRLGHYCWQYALQREAIPYLDRSLESDDFPVVCQVFGGAAAAQLTDGWYDLTGKPRPETKTGASKDPGPRPTAAPASGSGSPPPPSLPPGTKPSADQLAKVTQRYEQGVTKYRTSFGDSAEASSSLKEARRLLGEARDLLNALGDDASLDEIRQKISRLLFDCNKRSSI